jgi:NADPH:quinone reductase-like Zn-dependent oxidoreductase
MGHPRRPSPSTPNLIAGTVETAGIDTPEFEVGDEVVAYAQMVTGLLSPLPKENGWTLAQHAGHSHPGRMQTILYRGAGAPGIKK